MIRALVLLLGLLSASFSYAEYDDYCYELADKLAFAPSTMGVGDLDGLKSCIQEIQRAVVVMHEDLPVREGASKYQQQVVAQKAVECPKAAEICPDFMAKQSSSNAQKEKQAAEKRKQQLQKFKPVLQAY